MDQRAAQLLASLAAATDDQYRAAVRSYLTSNHTDALMQVFRHPALRRKTLGAIGQLNVAADRGDRVGVPEKEREAWRVLREAAREEKRAIAALAWAFDPKASPRRRALQRMAAEYPADWERLLKEGGGPNKVSLRQLVELDEEHRIRFSTLLWEERDRQAP